MDKAKILAVLEKNVEWVAMGLGALFLLFVAWTYGVNNPAPIEVAGDVYTAGSVDNKVEEVSKQLEEKLADRRIPRIQVENVADRFVGAFNSANPTPDSMIAAKMDFRPRRDDVTAPVIPNINNQNPAVITQVIELPVVPPVKLEEVRAGQSYVAEPEKKVVAAAENEIVPNDAGARLPVKQPVAPAVDPAANPLAQIPGKDRTWATVFGKFNDAELTNAFRKVGVPQWAEGHVFIEVQLERREVKGPNSFGEPELVRGLPHNELPVPRNQPIEYIQAAIEPENVRTILQPLFYQVLSGTFWEVPGQALAAQQNQAPLQTFIDPVTQKFDAAQAAMYYRQLTLQEQKKFRDSLPADNRRLLMGEVQKLIDQERRQNNPQPNQTGTNPRNTNPRGGVGREGPGGSGRSPVRGREYMAADESLFQEMYASGSASDARRGNPRLQGREGPGNPRLMGREGPGAPLPGNAEMPMAPQIGEFGLNPDGTIDVWQHDETAQPGKTYQYRIRVVIKNPLFGTENIAKDAKLAQEPYLLDPKVAPWSEWSKPVVIPPDLKMQFVHGVGDRSNVRVNIRRFQKGKYQVTPSPVTAEPGDIIGGKMGDVDYTTGWTLVDVRRVGNDTQVRIIDKDGNMAIRSAREDQADPDFQKAAPAPATPDAIGGANPTLINPIIVR